MDYKELIRQLRQEAQSIRDRDSAAWAIGYEQAATAIETLLAERQTSGWISVKDRLPEPGERVLFSVGQFVAEGYRTSADTWYLRGGEPARCRHPGTVTHWMPLPNPPEEG